MAADPARSKDRLAASYLIALGARIVREVGDLWRRARLADKHLATLSIDTEIRFASPASGFFADAHSWALQALSQAGGRRVDACQG